MDELTPSHCTALSFVPTISVPFLNFHSKQICVNKQYFPLTLSRVDFLGSTHGWWETKWFALSKICHTYPTTLKLGTVIPYVNKIQKPIKLRDTPLEFCQHHDLFHQNSATFAIWRNAVVDYILIYNFYLF